MKKSEIILSCLLAASIAGNVYQYGFAKNNAEDNKKTLSEVQSKVETLTEQNNNLQNEIKAVKATNENLTKETTEFTAKIEQLNSELEKVQAEKESAEKAAQEAEDAKKAAEQQAAAAKQTQAQQKPAQQPTQPPAQSTPNLPNIPGLNWDGGKNALEKFGTSVPDRVGEYTPEINLH